MGVNHGKLGVGQVYQKCGKCCKGGTGQWGEMWQIGCWLDVQKIWQVLQRGNGPMGLDHGRLGVGRVYQKCGKCCKGETGRWVLIMADWVSAGCRNGASAAKVDRPMDHSHCRTGVG